MRYSSTTKTRRSAAGFTLVEMMVIAPIVILSIGIFIGVMVSMVGDVLASRDQSSMTHDIQSALNQIEQDTRLSTQFLATTNTVTHPQGRDGNFRGTAAFTSANDLAIGSLTTDKNPTDSSRQLIYYAEQPNPCNSGKTSNRMFISKVVYFIKDGSLWRRTILPPYDTNATPNDNTVCDTPWQQNSCIPDTVHTRCLANDMELAKNVTSFSVKYYLLPESTTPLSYTNALNASTIEVTINSSKTVAGNTVDASESIRVSRLNDIDVELPAPGKPNLSYSSPTPDKVNFKWDLVAAATSYKILYNINGGSWTSQTLSGQTTSRIVEAKRGDIITFSVAAHNSTGTSGYATKAATIPLWNDLDLQYNWENYGGTYDAAAYTKTSDGTVFIKGLIRNGDTAQDTIIATLPEGYRPSGRLLMTTSSYNSTKPAVSYLARVDIDADGNIRFRTGHPDWLSINLAFTPSSSPYAWHNAVLESGWTNWGGGYAPLQATRNSAGRVHLQGLIRPGTQTANTTISTLGNLSANYIPSAPLHFMGGHDSVYAGAWVSNTSGIFAKRGPQTPSLIGVNMMYYPSTYTAWTNLTLQNGWLNFGGIYPTAQFTVSSDRVVTLQGLIKSGTATNGTVIGNLPASLRPKGTLIFNASSSEEYGRVDVLSNGDIVFRSGSAGWFSLNQVSFVADQ